MHKLYDNRDCIKIEYDCRDSTVLVNMVMNLEFHKSREFLYELFKRELAAWSRILNEHDVYIIL
jgi:hypothetical protein